MSGKFSFLKCDEDLNDWMGMALRSKSSAPLPYSNGVGSSVAGALFESSPRLILLERIARQPEQS